MMKAVVAGLLAAAAMVVPAVAMAQDVSLREAMRQRMEARGGPGGRERAPQVRPDGGRGAQVRTGAESGGWQQPERPERSERAERPEQPRTGVPAQAAGGWQRPDRTARPDRQRPDVAAQDRGGWQRGDRDGRGAEAVAERDRRLAQGQRDPRDGRPLWTERDFRGDGDARRDRDANRDGRDRDWNRDRDQRAGSVRDRDRERNRGRNWNRDSVGWDQRAQGDRDRAWNDRSDRGQWNRDWRRDPRYDWSRYRTGNRSAYRLPRYYAPYGWNRGYQRFTVGVRLSSVLFAQDYWIDDPYSYRLPEVDGPYRWVRYYDDALLVDIYTGQVVDVVNDMFWQG